MAEPASIVSTPRISSLRAIKTFSSVESDTPGVCSPSLSVVSKNRMSLLTNKTIPSGHTYISYQIVDSCAFTIMLKYKKVSNLGILLENKKRTG
jgi:hypothetical protein